MTDKPIPLKAHEVRAILESRKTQMRRVLKTDERGYRALRPYELGDRLWVRETWRLSTPDDCTHYDPCNCRSGQPLYCADPGAKEWSEGLRWRPSIHMPRWASRLTLYVTDVKVERLQEISEEDARAEGCEPKLKDKHGTTEPGFEYRYGFALLWNSINAKRPGCVWEDNPWVVAVTFEARCGNIDNLPERLAA